MSATITLYPSDLTPPPNTFLAIAKDVARKCGAVWLGEEGEYDLRLNNGTEIIFDVLEFDGGAYLDLPDTHESGVDLVHELAQQTGCFVSVWASGGSISSTDAPTCALPATGSALDLFKNRHAEPQFVADRRTFEDWFRVAVIEALASRQATPPRRPQRSLMQRLSDTLFGREI